MRARLRRLRFGLQTVLGLGRRGFFIPYRYAAGLPDPPERGGYPELEPLFAAAEPAFRDLLTRIDAHAPALLAIGNEPPPAPRWTQDWFPGLDAAAAYVLVRDRAPARIVEIGSGHSTRFLARAIRDEGLTCRLTSIDPAPRADIAGLADTVLRCTLHEAGLQPFAELAAGDMLFIDSSHILMPGTDVDVLFNRVLPTLPSGALVHVHDVFLPDGYPASWAWRGYNEQLAISGLLGGAWWPVWASRYVRTRMDDAVGASAAGRLPLAPGALESSLWLEKG